MCPHCACVFQWYQRLTDYRKPFPWTAVLASVTGAFVILWTVGSCHLRKAAKATESFVGTWQSERDTLRLDPDHTGTVTFRHGTTMTVSWSADGSTFFLDTPFYVKPAPCPYTMAPDGSSVRLGDYTYRRVR